MKIVTADVELDLGYCQIGAHVPTVVADSAAIAIRRATAAAGLPLRVSGMGHYTRHYCGQDLDGKRLLVWRGCGLGDQLMASAVVRGLLVRYRRAAVDLYCDPRVHAMLWEGVEGLPFTPMAEPIPLSWWLAYDYHLVLADMCEADSEPNQEHTVDRMLWAAGRDPRAVAPGNKLPFVPLTAEDEADAQAIIDGALMDVSAGRGHGLPPDPRGMGTAAGSGEYTGALAAAPAADAGTRGETATAGGAGVAGQDAAAANAGTPGAVRMPEGSGETRRPGGVGGRAPLVLWQVGASTPIRSYRPDLARRALAGLVQAGCRVLATGTAAEFAAYGPLPAGVEAVRGQRLRTVFALCGLADVTVAPDSVLMHAAGGLRRPCVGLWGSFSPAWRARYYPEHRALVGRGGCPQAPCGTHECGNQPEGCPRKLGRPSGERYCEAIAGIAPEAVVAAVLEIAGK